ncbi:MAG: 3-isopropylmalate dehydratase small subunit [Deltaproteobacteria bacterium]|nr:3-isopropylmalate dehydratase small subunit [Deltaproteobacteria bacterium]
MSQFITLRSRMVLLPLPDIETDQIIPARVLKATDKVGMGRHLFADWRYREDGSPNPEFILNQPGAQGARVLLAGDNFGCGSSREHAPWALADFGFRAIVSTSFADIFRGNALKNGVLPVVVPKAVHKALVHLVTRSPGVEILIDLASQSMVLPTGESVTFPIDEFSKTCLLRGVDELGYLLSLRERIAEYEEACANGKAGIFALTAIRS